jgi:uncharacterized membrane protein YagU involved in acid resistance
VSKVTRWRSKLSYTTLILILILFELILSVIFLSLSHIWGNLYFKGVGVGLTISWVTSALAYPIVKRAKATVSSAMTKD